MNYYPRFIGDYQRDTSDLSLTEHGAYNQLLDHYYAGRKPLPNDLNRLYRIARATKKFEQEAVRSVADRFFPVAADGLRRNKKADEQISIWETRCTLNQHVGKLGGRPPKNVNKINESDNPDGFDSETQRVFSRNPNGFQNKTHRKPSPSPSPSPSPNQDPRYRSEEGAREPKVEPRKFETETEQFANWQRFRATYPRGTYPEADFMLAEKSGNLRLDEGTPFSEFLDGAQRFRDQQDALGNIGTRFVPSPKNFFDRLTRLWTEKFPLPAPPTPKNGHDSMESWTLPVGDPRYDADLAEKLRNEAAAPRFKA
jgi:uncharacterized protein YdaU (DUF1376 family)